MLLHLAALLSLLCLSCRAASEAARPMPDYVTHFWQTKDGLPENSVTSIVQTRNGYLWIGTRGGLVRFDGVRFTVFNAGNTPEMQSPHVTSLFEANDDTLWIGHEDGALTSYRNGKFQSVPVHAAWRGDKIFGISADAAGDLWLLNTVGELARVRDGAVIAAPSSVTHLLALVKNPRGGFWVQRDTEVAAMENGQLKPLSYEGPATNAYIQGIGATRDGGLWIMTENRIRKWKDGKWLADFGPAPWEWAPVHTIVELKDGSVAAASADHGLYILVPGQEESRQFCRTNGFTSDWITSLCQDREGNLWAGTGNGGLAVLRPGHVTVLDPPDQWQGRAVLSVAAGPDGALWAGTEGAGLYRYHDGVWTNFSGATHRYVWSVIVDARNRAWIGTWGGGVFFENEARFDRPSGLNDMLVATIFPAHDGALLVGTSTSLLRLEEGKTTCLGGKPTLVSPDVRAIAEGGDGTIWFGMSGGGLGCWHEGNLRQYRRTDGLSSEFVQCLHLESNGTLWVGTFGGGLNRFKDGRFTAVNRSQGMPAVICNIQDDERGYFWISSHNGITRVSKEDLNRCADGPTNRLDSINYGVSDGLPTLECSGGSQPAGCRAPDGRLWFPTVKGLVGIDPSHVKINHWPPPVVIEEIRVDGEAITNALTTSSGSTPSGLRIPPGRHRVEFDFTGLSFVAPERVRFKYRLAGLDRDWIDAGASGPSGSKRQANYTYILPGDYVFHVTACNNDGVWNELGAAFAFTVLPQFWQTWWFRVASGIAAAAMVGGAVLFETRRRMRRKLEGLERQQAIERERARIAKDIHDDLGAGLTRISLFSESVPAELVSPPQAAEALNRIFATTHEMTLAMDEIVWAVNPQHDTLDSLVSYLGKLAQELLKGTGVRCRLDMPLQLPNWRLEAEVRHNVFLAFKESLNNVLRHAQANEVRVHLSLYSNAFTFVVEDDGKGFTTDPAGPAARPSGELAHCNGLANMRQRLTEIGGRCEITSTPGKGARVAFHVFLNHAPD